MGRHGSLSTKGPSMTTLASPACERGGRSPPAAASGPGPDPRRGRHDLGLGRRGDPQGRDLGRPSCPPGHGGRSTARWPQPAPGARPLRELAPVLQAHLGSLHVANGNLHEAAAAFSRGTDATAWSPARTECLGRLAHVRALQGDLRRAGRVAGLVPTPVPGVASPGAAHAQLARAWIALERADFADARRRLELVAVLLRAGPGGVAGHERAARRSPAADRVG